VGISSGYDDIFMVIRGLIVLSELDLFDRGGTLGSLLIIPVDYWTLHGDKSLGVT
jgi:hypothetical protein